MGSVTTASIEFYHSRARRPGAPQQRDGAGLPYNRLGAWRGAGRAP